MEAFYPFIVHINNLEHGKLKNKESFHILGIDVLLDQNCKPWLLEINSAPSLDIIHEKEHGSKNVRE